MFQQRAKNQPKLWITRSGLKTCCDSTSQGSTSERSWTRPKTTWPPCFPPKSPKWNYQPGAAEHRGEEKYGNHEHLPWWLQPWCNRHWSNRFIIWGLASSTLSIAISWHIKCQSLGLCFRQAFPSWHADLVWRTMQKLLKSLLFLGWSTGWPGRLLGYTRNMDEVFECSQYLECDQIEVNCKINYI